MAVTQLEAVASTLIAERSAPGKFVRGLTKRWLLREAGPSESAPTADAGLLPLVQRVLTARGIHGAAQIQSFCDPKLTDLYDPALMPNIDAAAARLIDAVRRDEVIVIYGDYDVDGITATAILYHTIKAAQQTARLRTYIPHRLDEGYGLNCEALRQLKAEGAHLVISVDCGITAAKSAQTAREIGLDLIITDHHDLPHDLSRLPEALALVHPRLPGSAYPFGELCGAGVAFKLAWRFATLWCNSQRVSEALQKILISALPLVALATIADVVPLIDENRILTAFGLRLIKQTPLVGLRALIDAAGLMDEKIDSHKVGFVLGPRLNACGRMGHAADAVRMLTEASPEEAMSIARKLTELNQHRQSVERHILEQATGLAEDGGMTGDDRRVIVLAHESWHPGVVGIVCSRLAERYGRPVVLLHRQRDLCKGSARSIDGYSIHEGLCAAAQHLTTYGGHAMAAGLTLSPDHLEAFIAALTEHANEHISIEQLTPSITIDCDAALSELDLETVQRLSALSPFGRGNRPPMLRVCGAIIAEPPRQMGANGKHLSMQLRQETSATGRRWMRTVWWNAGERAGDLAAGMKIDVAIDPKVNDWKGRVSVEAQLHDVRLCDENGQ